MDNIVLDVAIGLVFIYLLYSLLATTINEFVAMIFAYRHRMLEKAIEQMLDGKNYSYYWWDKIANGFLWMFQMKKQKNTSTHIQKILQKDDNPNPLPVDKKDFFRPCYINTNRPEQEQKVYIKRRKLNKKASLFAANITNHPLYRRKSEQSILYKKPAYLSASAFSDILFDVLSSRRSEINATPVMMNDIKTFVSNQLQNNPGLKSILNMYIEQANGDVQKFKLLLEDWFDDTMDRVSGWYKRQATKVLFVIGLVLAFAFNVSTIEIVDKLSVNKDLRETMAKSASAYVENANKKQSASGTSTKGNQTSTDTAFANVQQQINNIQKLYKDTVAKINMMMGLGWEDFGHASKYAPLVAERRIKDSVFISNYISNNVKPNNTGHKILLYKKGKLFDSLTIAPDPRNAKESLSFFLNSRYKVQGEASIWEKIGYVLTHVSMRDIIGFLITALAITLGAPFWFDLLNKFVNIRAGGNKPSEDATDNNSSTISKNGTLNQKPAPNSFA
jgi:hypothetical protein